jgi:hypothetical protein
MVLHARLALALALIVACDVDDDTDGGLVEPSFDAKSDELSGVEDGGELTFGGEASGVFERDFQFFGYTFEAREDAEVTIEVTQKGSSQALDTTLFLYALTDGEEPRRIVVDDDDGFGALSRIDRFRLFEAGRYAVVIGTKDAGGRGKFRVTLACDSGECGAVKPPDTPCPRAMQAGMVECLHDTSSDFSLESRFDELITEACATESDLETFREDACAESTEPFCEGDQAIIACEAFALASYPSPERVKGLLTEIDDPAMQALEDAAHASDVCGEFDADAGCVFAGSIFTYDPAQSIALAELLAHARTQLDSGPGVAAEQDTPDGPAAAFDGFMGFFGIGAEAKALLDALGVDLSGANVATAFGEFQFSGGDCQADIVVVQFPDTGTVLDFNVLSCSG